GWGRLSTRRDANPLPHRVRRPRRLRAHHPAAAVLRRTFWRLAADRHDPARDLLADVDDFGAALGTDQRPDRTAAGPDGEHAGRRVRLSLAWLRDGIVDAVRGAGLCRSLRRQYRGGAGLYRRCDTARAARPRHGDDPRRLRPRLYYRARHGRNCRRQRARDRRSASPGADRGRIVVRGVSRGRALLAGEPTDGGSGAAIAQPHRGAPERAAAADAGAPRRGVLSRDPGL